MYSDDVDLLADDIVSDPYPLYAELRRNRPLSPLKNGGYLLTRHEDILSALANRSFRNAPSRFSVLHASKSDRYVSSRIANAILPFQDGDIHTENRRRVVHALRSRNDFLVTTLPSIVEEVRLTIEPMSSLDIVSDFGKPFSVAVMARLLGIDINDANELTGSVDLFFRLFAPVTSPSAFKAVEDDLLVVRERMESLIIEQSKSGSSGLLSDLRALEPDDPDAALAFAASNALLLFADGIQNVQYAIGSVWSLLHEHDSNVVSLDDDPNVMRAAVGEVLRLESPAQSIPRIADEELTLHGTTIARDTPIHLSLASANRDESVFRNPDMFIPDNTGGRDRAIAFGAGRHSCLGGSLATEMIVAAVAALRRLPLSPTAPYQSLPFEARFGHRWPASVMAVSDNNRLN